MVEKKMRIRLDVNNMFTEKVGEEHGIDYEKVNEYQDRTIEIHNTIQQSKNEGKMGFMELPHQDEKIIKKINEVVAERDNIENFVVLGIGGSALGGIALRSALKDPYHNYFSAVRNGCPRLFVPDNVDPARFKSLLDNLDLEKTVFNVISKSGGTAETMSQFLIVRQAIVEQLGRDKLSEHIIATTSSNSGYLIKIAREENLIVFYIPDNVGGRFSVLTPVGLLCAAFVGINIEQLLKGASFMAKICQVDNIWKNPAYLNALLQYISFQKGKNISVMMPYSHALRDFADWYRQLWAESLGKKYDRDGNIVYAGPTPVKALGATDQHSQAQLYMEGPYDKVITFLEVENQGTEVEIPPAYSNLDGVSYLGGHTLNELLTTEKKATELALTKRQRLNETIVIPEVNEFTMGQLFYMFELQTAFIGELFNIDAFNQPGVELGKNYTYGILGRDGYDKIRKEYINRPGKNDNLII